MHVSAPALKVCETLTKAGHQAFVVGGCVRDTLLGIEPKDWDVTTSAKSEEVTSQFRRVHPTGIDFGTVTVMMGDEPIEVTTFRADSPITDGRRPESVTFSETIEEDLSRRDFTCNAIAYDPTRDLMVDPHGGVQDIEGRVLRAVGDPEVRFQEDQLRVFRAIRFCTTKGFELEPNTSLKLQAHASWGGFRKYLSTERIRDELLKILASPNVGHGLHLLNGYGILEDICPELAAGVGLSQNRYHHWTVWEHTRQCVMAEKSGDPNLRLAILLHDISKPETRAPHPKNLGEFQFIGHEKLGAERAEAWLREFHFPNETIEMVTHCIKHHLIYYTPDWTDRQLRRWLRKVGPKHLNELLELRRCDIAGKGPGDFPKKDLEEHDRFLERLKTVEQEVPHSTAHLALRGKEVMQIRKMTRGGPIVGQILDHLLEIVTDDPELNTVEALTPLVENYQ